jgi:hypothetical protein
MSRSCTLVLALALSAGTAAHAGTLADGQPPLTDELVGQFFDYYEWFFETELTVAQRQALQALLVDSWKTKNDKNIHDALDTLRNRDDLAKMAADERDMMRSQVQPQLLVELKRDKSSLSQWALPVYEAAHKPLAAGKPPLTRQDCDALGELMAFLVHETVGGPTFEPDAAFRDSLAKSVATGWKKLKPPDRDALSKLPLTWAGIRGVWAALPEADKAKYRKDWTTALAFLKPGAAAPGGTSALAPLVPPSETARWMQSLLTAPLPSAMAVLDRFSTDKAWHYDVKRAW